MKLEDIAEKIKEKQEFNVEYPLDNRYFEIDVRRSPILTSNRPKLTNPGIFFLIEETPSLHQLRFFGTEHDGSYYFGISDSLVLPVEYSLARAHEIVPMTTVLKLPLTGFFNQGVLLVTEMELPKQEKHD